MENLQKEFVPYELAVKLKELGFDEPCFGFYGSHKEFNFNDMLKKNSDLTLLTNWISAPTFSQAFRWVMQFPQIKKYSYNVALYSDGTYSLKDGKDSIYEYLSAESCLEKLIEIVEREK